MRGPDTHARRLGLGWRRWCSWWLAHFKLRHSHSFATIKELQITSNTFLTLNWFRDTKTQIKALPPDLGESCFFVGSDVVSSVAGMMEIHAVHHALAGRILRMGLILSAGLLASSSARGLEPWSDSQLPL